MTIWQFLKAQAAYRNTENYLVERNVNFLDFEDEVCNNYLKLLVAMYADDTIILCNTAEGLQNALDHLGNYCDEWKIKVNIKKTKITIFGSKKTNHNHRFHYKGEELEIVNSFKYLGVFFNTNGKFIQCKKTLKEQATKALFSLLNKCRRLDLTLDIKLELLDHTVLPILMYGCEIWGFGSNKILETVHLKFLKYILGHKISTPSCIIHGETGRYPIDIYIKARIIQYWLTIVNGKRDKLCYKMYCALDHI